ncbi:hypothetical protein ACQ859_13210 [Roseateles chitinivorans]|uniref:hypothetical protein n=1 Tax=Roseateles chitinivorans TaxID=2917965 RepID=UPI003D664C08
MFADHWSSVLILACLAAGTTAAAAAPGEVAAGMTCTVPDGWWSLDRERPQQPEPVKVLAVKPLTTGTPGAWVQPQRGKLTDQQMHLALERLTDCR